MNGTRIALVWCALVALAPAQAQTPPLPAAPAPTLPAPPDAPAPPAPATPDANPPNTPQARLDIAPRERQYFALGTTLAQGTFAYAHLGAQAGRIEQGHAVRAKVAALGRLAPDALRARATARDSFTQAAALMQALQAPPAILSPITRLAARLSRPLALTADSRAIRSLNPDAAVALSALSESNIVARVMDDRALTQWLNGAEGHRSGPVWYAEGQIAGIAQIAAASHLPDLLPPAADVATDLRGLRDWLALRVPERPGPDLAALQSAIADFLQQTAQGPGERPLSPTRRMSEAQLQQLGSISQALQAQIIPPDVPLLSPNTH